MLLTTNVDNINFKALGVKINKNKYSKFYQKLMQ